VHSIAPHKSDTVSSVTPIPLIDQRVKAVGPINLFTAAVWCVPFSGTVGLFNQLQTKINTYQIWLELRRLPQILLVLVRRTIN
jgi:hypothetical protein